MASALVRAASQEPPPSYALTPREREVLILMVEGLNNVVKHAHASQVTVALRCSPPLAGGMKGGAVELYVSDDGCGFDPSVVPPDRLGLGIIRKRAQAVGAASKIESRPGHGTQVVVVWKG